MQKSCRRVVELRGPGGQTGFATDIPSTGKVTQSPGRVPRAPPFPSLKDTLLKYSYWSQYQTP